MDNVDFYKEAWKFAMDELHQEYKSKNNEDEFLNWFKMDYVGYTENTITVSVATPFLRQFMLTKNYFDLIQSKIQKITNQENLKIDCIIQASENLQQTEASETLEIPLQEKKSSDKEDKKEKSEKNQKKHPLLMEDFTFETFVPGDNSNFAYNAAIAVAKNPGKEYNPVLFYGGSGLGKTHLMQAIGNYIYNNVDSKLKICYISSESLMNEFTSALATKKTDSFKNKYRNLDVLLLDDIQFLSNKPGLQEELFYTFNALSEKKSQMVFTCDRPINEVKNMTERLVSRLSNGVRININIPNFETRCAILKKKIAQKKKSLDEEIISYIAEIIETNVRDLESALENVFAYSDLVGQTPTLESVKEQLSDILNQRESQNISIEIIQKVIAENYQISVSDIKSKKRDKKFVIPRQIAIYLARELTESSFQEIGEEFGGKDHSTIMHSYEKIAESKKIDSSLSQKIQIFIDEIKRHNKK